MEAVVPYAIRCCVERLCYLLHDFFLPRRAADVLDDFLEELGVVAAAGFKEEFTRRGALIPVGEHFLELGRGRSCT